MNRTTTALILPLTLTLAPAAADVYRYRTPDGRWVITNTPPPAGTDATTSAEGTGAMTTTAPQPEAFVRPVPELNTAAPVPAATPERPAARSVDTLAFANLREGMSQVEVQTRLGPPTFVSQGNATRSSTVVEVWQYPGDRHLGAVRLMFRNDALTDKIRD